MMFRIGVLLVLVLGIAIAMLSLSGTDVAHLMAGSTEPVLAPDPDPPPEAEPTPAPTERKVSIASDLYSFDYAYPPQAAAIPALRDQLERKIAHDKDRVEAEAEQSRQDAKGNGYPFQPHYFDLDWSVTADLPGWLALGAAVQTYSGGAHPNQDFDSLVWDRQAGKALEPLDMFISPEELNEAVHERYCDELDKERAKRREQSVEQVRKDTMWECPQVSDLVIELESEDGKGFDHLALLAAPYVAGAYVEGSYTIELPIDRSVLDAVKPLYREAFSKAQ